MSLPFISIERANDVLRNILGTIAVVFVASFYPTLAAASSLETLIMPGKVINGHAKWETACEKCHEPFRKTMQNSIMPRLP